MFFLALLACGECDPSTRTGSLICPEYDEGLTRPEDTPIETPDGVAVETLAVGAPRVDILFAIDNSDFTDPEHFHTFVRSLDGLFDVLDRSGLDYHVGAMSTVDRDPMGELAGWATRRTREPQLLFQTLAPENAAAGYGRESVYAALSDDLPANTGFRRPDAPLHVVFFTAQDDLSLQPHPVEFTAWLQHDSWAGGTAHAITDGRIADYHNYVIRTDGKAAFFGERFDWHTFTHNERPAPLQLAHVPESPENIQVVLVEGPRRDMPLQATPVDPRVGPQMRVCEDESPGCTLLYRPEHNALFWLVSPRRDVDVAQIRYAMAEPAE